ncbi:MAG: phosphoribosylanthranilate isomerase [Eubacteriales bacterium]|nr:phosphoribosylanthranilate isomerase [Eubacteriales bacterium]
MNGTKIKICGLFRREDAEAVNRALPDYAGFVFYEKSCRNVTPELARVLRTTLRPAVRTVGVFVNASVERIARLYQEGIIGIAQLHGDEDAAYIATLRAMLPAVEIWKAYKIHVPEELAAAAASTADKVLLDSGGGTGARFDWSLAERFPRSFILAGGLTPETIPEAIARLHPFAVDLSSGVETDRVKDEAKIKAAVAAARRS